MVFLNVWVAVDWCEGIEFSRGRIEQPRGRAFRALDMDSKPRHDGSGIKANTVTELSTLSTGDCAGKIPVSRFRHAACVSGDYLYVHGGRSGHRALRDFWRLNLSK